uniref:Uncharacterized protein n=1 Tax=Vitis vinifera TaxID=29760 RepID=F6HBV1_VITVI
MLGSSSVPDD